MTSVHEFQTYRTSDHVAEYWHAHCSCGWSGAYTHAAESYARHDWAWHVQQAWNGGEAA